MPGPTRIVLGQPKTFPACSYLGYKAVHGGAAFRRLVELRAQGRIAKVGVSAYTPEEVAMRAKAHLGRHTGRLCAQLMTDRPTDRAHAAAGAGAAGRPGRGPHPAAVQPPGRPLEDAGVPGRGRRPAGRDDSHPLDLPPGAKCSTPPLKNT